MTPTIDAVARLLQTRDGIDPELAGYAARAAQGHVGRARALARSEPARDRRAAILKIPFRLEGLSACLNAADTLVKTAAEEAASGNVKRVVRAGAAERDWLSERAESPYAITAFMEMKTVWHPKGA